MNRRELIAHFDRLAEFTDPMIERGIETHRKGLFAVKLLGQDGKPLAGVPVHVTRAARIQVRMRDVPARPVRR